MKIASLAFGLVLTILLAATASSVEVISGKVVHISDGDTVTVLTESHKQIKVRLYGIDCPEKRQAYGNRARQAISSMIAGKEVRVRSMALTAMAVCLALSLALMVKMLIAT